MVINSWVLIRLFYLFNKSLKIKKIKIIFQQFVKLEKSTQNCGDIIHSILERGGKIEVCKLYKPENGNELYYRTHSIY